MIAKFIGNSSFGESYSVDLTEDYILQYLDEGIINNLGKLLTSAKLKAKALKDKIKSLPKMISKIKEIFMKNVEIGLKKAFQEENINPASFDTSFDEILSEINQKLLMQNAKMLNASFVMESSDLKEFVEFTTGIDWSTLQNSCSPEMYEFLVNWGDLLMLSISSFLADVLRRIFGKKDDYVLDALENPNDIKMLANKIARKTIFYTGKGFIKDLKILVKNF